MTDALEFAKPPRFIRERRVRARHQPPSVISLILGEGNSGVVLNLSEDGLALSAASVLPEDHFHAMRIQLQESGDGFEASGQIVWRSSSGKKAGIRFVGLPEEARQRLHNWIFPASSRDTSSPRPDANREKPQPLDPDPIDPSAASPPDWARPGTIEDSSGEVDPSDLLPIADIDSRIDGGGALSRGADRRTSSRTRIVPLGYIQVGDSNGGIALNVSEGGLAMTVAMVMGDDHLPSLRLQFPDTDDWIETSGRIVWRSESGKEAGVRFVGLTGKAQQQLRTWIRSQPATAPVEKPFDRTGEEQHHSEIPYTLPLEAVSPVSDRITSDWTRDEPAEQAENSLAFPEPFVFPEILDRIPVVPAPDADQAEPLVGKILDQRSILEHTGARKWATLAAVVGLVALGTLTLVHMRSTPDVQTSPIAAVQQKTAAPQEAVQNAPSLAPTISSPSAESAVPPDHRTAEPSPRPAPLSPHNSPGLAVATKPSPAIPFPTRNLKGPRRALNDVGAASQSPAALRVVPGSVNKAAANNVPPPAVESLAVGQSQANKIASLVDSVPLPPKYTPPVDLKRSAKERASSEPPPKPQPPPNVQGLVAIRTDPYPALHMPAESGGKKSKKAARLQLGHIVSRVEPIYPDEAKQRGIEGTVTVHAVIGRNGSVESVTTVNGPPVLASAVTSAVRQWRYTETLLAGQTVETEDDISVTFRLSGSTASQK